MARGRSSTSIGHPLERAGMAEHAFIPALRYAWLTRLYDPLVALTCRERSFRKQLLALSDLHPGDRVLDLACGTGTFAVMLKRHQPQAHVFGLDADPEVLKAARAKAAGAGVEICLDEGMSFGMPYADGSFDAVFSSLFFHHLQTAQKLLTLTEVRRVLKPGGTLRVCDWGPAGSPYTRLAFTAVRMLDGFDVTRDSVEGRLPDLMVQTGFVEVHPVGEMATVLGTLQFLAGRKRQEAIRTTVKPYKSEYYLNILK